MTKRLPAAPAPGPSKDHEAHFNYLFGAQERATLLKPQTGNHTEPGHPILSALLYALIVPDFLGMSLGNGAAPYRNVGTVARLAVALKP